MYHSIELTLLTLAIAIATVAVTDQLAVDRFFVTTMAIAIWGVIVGHFLAIWASPRLRA
jgi:hypothetical protein